MISVTITTMNLFQSSYSWTDRILWIDGSHIDGSTSSHTTCFSLEGLEVWAPPVFACAVKSPKINSCFAVISDSTSKITLISNINFSYVNYSWLDYFITCICIQTRLSCRFLPFQCLIHRWQEARNSCRRFQCLLSGQVPHAG